MTPVSEASGLQDDLRRARIEPFAWVVNRSLAASGTRDPALAARISAEAVQIARVKGLSSRFYVVPWTPRPPVGVATLTDLVTKRAPESASRARPGRSDDQAMPNESHRLDERES